MEGAFHAEDIRQRYGRRDILTGCTVTAGRGEIVGVAGRNGSGKSTLLSVCAGAAKPLAGRVLLGERDLLREGPSAWLAVGYVPQTNPLIEELSAADNLRLLAGRSVRSDEPFFDALKLKEFAGTKVRRLSGGMKRRLAIACALTEHPEVLIMDEPTSALDLYHKGIIYDYLALFRSEGGIVVMATHDLEEMELCDRLYLISDGRAETCSPDEAVRAIKGGY